MLLGIIQRESKEVNDVGKRRNCQSDNFKWGSGIQSETHLGKHGAKYSVRHQGGYERNRIVCCLKVLKSLSRKT